MIERAVPVLPGDSVTVAREFYVNRLGFTEQWGFSDDGRNGMLGVARGTIELTIDCPMTGHGRNACASLNVHDADAYYGEWRSRVEEIGEPKDEEWNARTFSVTDPFGNTLFVIGRPRTSPASKVHTATGSDQG